MTDFQLRNNALCGDGQSYPRGIFGVAVATVAEFARDHIHEWDTRTALDARMTSIDRELAGGLGRQPRSA